MSVNRFSLCILFAVNALFISAQKGYEVGGWIGAAQYFGDLNTRITLNKPGPALGLTGRYNFNTRTAIRTSLNYARLGADDDNSTNNFERLRNLSFASNLVEWTTMGEFNFYEYIHGHEDFWYTPYLAAGFSLFYNNPITEFQGDKYALRKLGTEGQAVGDEYRLINPALVLAAGMKWDINRDWSFNVELTFRKLFTDYLDDVSSVYTDKVSLQARRGPVAVALSDRSFSDGVGEPGHQRGNSRNNDTYVILSIGVMRYFGRIECPPISRIR